MLVDHDTRKIAEAAWKELHHDEYLRTTFSMLLFDLETPDEILDRLESELYAAQCTFDVNCCAGSGGGFRANLKDRWRYSTTGRLIPMDDFVDLVDSCCYR